MLCKESPRCSNAARLAPASGSTWPAGRLSCRPDPAPPPSLARTKIFNSPSSQNSVHPSFVKISALVHAPRARTRRCTTTLHLEGSRGEALGFPTRGLKADQKRAWSIGVERRAAAALDCAKCDRALPPKSPPLGLSPIPLYNPQFFPHNPPAPHERRSGVGTSLPAFRGPKAKAPAPGLP